MAIYIYGNFNHKELLYLMAEGVSLKDQEIKVTSDGNGPAPEERPWFRLVERCGAVQLTVDWKCR